MRHVTASVSGGQAQDAPPKVDRLDFMAVVVRFMPEETAWADVILSTVTHYEIEPYHLYRDHVRIRSKVIEYD